MKTSRVSKLLMSHSSRWFAVLTLTILAFSSVVPAAAAPSTATTEAPQAYPATIRVGRTFNKACVARPVIHRVDVVPFNDYVKNVLPNEWIASWNNASLDAGAVAVAQFAYQTAFVQKKWSSRGYNFDVVDSTCDQVYVPGSSHWRTNAAVDRMWGLKMVRNGRMFTPYYRAYACGGLCMSQRGSQSLARQGYSSAQILSYYYGPISLVR